jgi:membrane-associated phospholipid phosphatase
VLVWVWHRDFGAFKVARRQLYALNFIGVAAFMVWPSAPPRDAVRGVVDVVASLHGLANVHGHAAVAAVADEFGSFPSLHVATAVWCLWVVTKNSRKISAVVSWSVYLAVTSVVVVATGNHYVLDVVAGLPLGVGVCWVVTPAVALNRREWYRTVYLRSAHWARYAAARRADAHGACEECGAHGRLDVHHLTYARIGRERRRDTRVLCRNCHDRVHGVVAH